RTAGPAPSRHRGCRSSRSRTTRSSPLAPSRTSTCDNAPVTGSTAPSSQPAEPPAPSASEPPSHQGMLRHGWMGAAQVVAVAAIAAGALAAIYAERSTVLEGFVALRYVRVGWLVAGFGV